MKNLKRVIYGVNILVSIINIIVSRDYVWIAALCGWICALIESEEN